jgi:hypothetical protein
MYDIVYNFIMNVLLNADTIPAHAYYNELGLLLTHVTMWLFYVVLVMLIVHIFNSFRTMTRFW